MEKIKRRKSMNYAFQIEITLKAMFKCNRYDIGGIADRDFIEKQPFVAIIMVLGNFYNKIDNKSKEKIDKFLHKYLNEMDKSISEIEEDKMKNIIEEFHNIVSTI